jgi:hypothetical protein
MDVTCSDSPPLRADGGEEVGSRSGKGRRCKGQTGHELSYSDVHVEEGARSGPPSFQNSLFFFLSLSRDAGNPTRTALAPFLGDVHALQLEERFGFERVCF